MRYYVIHTGRGGRLFYSLSKFIQLGPNRIIKDAAVRLAKRRFGKEGKLDGLARVKSPHFYHFLATISKGTVHEEVELLLKKEE